MKDNWKKFFFGVLLALVLIVFLDAYIFERYFFKEKEFKIGYEGSVDSVNFLHLADIHLKKSPGLREKKLARKINSLKPDFVIITGDAIDQNGKAVYLDQFFSLINQDIKKVGIPGNHEYKSSASIEEVDRIYQKHNGVLLVNETKIIEVDDAVIAVTGLDDFVESEGDLPDAVSDIGFHKNHILLVHSPKQQESALKKVDLINKSRNDESKLNISYVFAGHNHGGQITFFGEPLFMPDKSGDYVSGWYNKKSPYLFVSKGIGTSAIPFRFFARAEIPIFRFYTASTS